MHFDVRPPRCFLVNVSTAESMECLFNPAEIVEQVDVHWARLQVPGLSHQGLQYQGTGNRRLSGLEFYLDRTFAEQLPGDIDIMAFRAFLRALTVPSVRADSVLTGAPPRTLFIWPQVLTIETVLTGLEFRYQQFGVDGRVLVYSAKASVLVGIKSGTNLDAIANQGYAATWSDLANVATPGNVMLFAHRTTGNAPFYYLHVLTTGDSFSLLGTDGKWYNYRVVDKRVTYPYYSTIANISTNNGPMTAQLVACSKLSGQPTSTYYRIVVTGRLYSVT